MQAVLWFRDTLSEKLTLEEHSSSISDVRFSPTRLALQHLHLTELLGCGMLIMLVHNFIYSCPW